MKIKKLNLEMLEVQSFITEILNEKSKTILGGDRTDPNSRRCTNAECTEKNWCDTLSPGDCSESSTYSVTRVG